MQSIDTLILAGHVLPVVPRSALRDHAVAIDKGRIVALLPRAEALARFAPRETVELPHHVLVPGLVNLHCHAAMTLMRGLADDQPLMTWLNDHIWPAEAKHVSDAFVHDGSLIAMAEMLRAGITTVNDMYFFPEATARAALQAGMRASLGVIVIEFPSAYAANADEYLQKGLAMADAYRGHEALSFCMAPHAPYTVGDAMLQKIAQVAEQRSMPVHMHIHETRFEVDDGVKQHGMRPFARLQQLGLVNERLIAVHAVHMDEGEMDLMAREHVKVAHNPSSNLKLASGMMPAAAMRARGIDVGLGSDGAASNNRLDILTEMRTAALLAKAVSGDASVLPAAETLEMATLQGARSLGLDADIGSLEVGKWADITAVDLASVEAQPIYDVASSLVYAAGREHVTDVWVGGEARLRERTLRTLDIEALQQKAAMWRGKLA